MSQGYRVHVRVVGTPMKQQSIAKSAFKRRAYLFGYSHTREIPHTHYNLETNEVGMLAGELDRLLDGGRRDAGTGGGRSDPVADVGKAVT